MTDHDSDNQMRWQRPRPGHYEVWYCTLNHRASRTGMWIRYTMRAPSDGTAPYAQLWFALFDADDPQRNVAVNRKLPIRELQHTAAPFRLQIGDAALSTGQLSGELTADEDGEPLPISWQLRFSPCDFTHHHLPGFAYRGPIADTKVLSPNLMTHFSGEVRVGDRVLSLEDEPGCQTHLWGRKHAHAWAWGHCNAFREDATATLELLSARLRRGPLVTPPLTLLSLYLGNEVYHFRDLRELPFTRGSWETGLFRFSAVGRRIKVEGEIRCRPEDLVRADYADPDGDPAYCHNTEVADATVTVFHRRGLRSRFRQLCRLTAHATAHFEYAGRLPDARVDRRHRTLED